MRVRAVIRRAVEKQMGLQEGDLEDLKKEINEIAKVAVAKREEARGKENQQNLEDGTGVRFLPHS